jgi:sec-independent protein translocase protein TatC
MSTTATKADRREGRMSLRAHLVELRRRMLFVAVAVLVAAVVGWFLSDPVLSAIRAPISEIARQQHRVAELNFTSISGAFDLRIQIAFVVGIVISSPFWLYQVWAFLVPALSRKQTRYTLGFLLSAIPLFLCGCAAGWFVVPHMVGLLTGFVPTQDSALIQASDYFTFVLKLVVAVGIAFVLPVLLVLLNFVGIISGLAIIKGWRIAIIATLAFTAVATPSADVVSMLLLAAPILVLYFAAAGISLMRDRKLARLTAELSLAYAGS